MWTISILVLGLTMGQGYHATPQSSESTTVSLCALLAQPNKYAGQTVQVTAILATNTEFAILTDHSYPSNVNPLSGKHDVVEPTFDHSQHDLKSAIDKKLTRLLKRKQQAKVTVIGLFIDPGHYFGHDLSYRYQLDIQRLISGEEVRQMRSAPEK